MAHELATMKEGWLGGQRGKQTVSRTGFYLGLVMAPQSDITMAIETVWMLKPPTANPSVTT